MYFRVVQQEPGGFAFEVVGDEDQALATSVAFAGRSAAQRAIEEVVASLREGVDATLKAERDVYYFSICGEDGAPLLAGAPRPSAAEADALLASVQRWAATSERFRVTLPVQRAAGKARRDEVLQVAIRYDLEQRSRSGAAGLELLQRTRDGLHSAHVNDEAGRAVVYLRGFSQRFPRDEAVESLLAAAADVRRYVRREADGRAYFVVVARNGRELARSRWFADVDAREAAIRWLVGLAPAETRRLAGGRTRRKVVESGYELARPSRSGAAGFEVFRGDDNNFYFHLNDPDGRALLYSHGYGTAQARDHGIRSLLVAAGSREDFVVARAGHHFTVVARNGRELVRSRELASRDEVERTIVWVMREIVGFARAYGVRLRESMILVVPRGPSPDPRAIPVPTTADAPATPTTLPAAPVPRPDAVLAQPPVPEPDAPTPRPRKRHARIDPPPRADTTASAATPELPAPADAADEPDRLAPPDPTAETQSDELAAHSEAYLSGLDETIAQLDELVASIEEPVAPPDDLTASPGDLPTDLVTSDDLTKIPDDLDARLDDLTEGPDLASSPDARLDDLVAHPDDLTVAHDLAPRPDDLATSPDRATDTDGLLARPDLAATLDPPSTRPDDPSESFAARPVVAPASGLISARSRIDDPDDGLADTSLVGSGRFSRDLVREVLGHGPPPSAQTRASVAVLVSKPPAQDLPPGKNASASDSSSALLLSAEDDAADPADSLLAPLPGLGADPSSPSLLLAPTTDAAASDPTLAAHPDAPDESSSALELAPRTAAHSSPSLLLSPDSSASALERTSSAHPAAQSSAPLSPDSSPSARSTDASPSARERTSSAHLSAQSSASLPLHHRSGPHPSAQSSTSLPLAHRSGPHPSAQSSASLPLAHRSGVHPSAQSSASLPIARGAREPTLLGSGPHVAARASSILPAQTADTDTTAPARPAATASPNPQPAAPAGSTSQPARPTSERSGASNLPPRPQLNLPPPPARPAPVRDVGPAAAPASDTSRPASPAASTFRPPAASPTFRPPLAGPSPGQSSSGLRLPPPPARPAPIPAPERGPLPAISRPALVLQPQVELAGPARPSASTDLAATSPARPPASTDLAATSPARPSASTDLASATSPNTPVAPSRVDAPTDLSPVATRPASTAAPAARSPDAREPLVPPQYGAAEAGRSGPPLVVEAKPARAPDLLPTHLVRDAPPAAPRAAPIPIRIVHVQAPRRVAPLLNVIAGALLLLIVVMLVALWRAPPPADPAPGPAPATSPDAPSPDTGAPRAST
jgi:uncharacterized protein YegP (UPF0339 family)